MPANRFSPAFLLMKTVLPLAAVLAAPTLAPAAEIPPPAAAALRSAVTSETTPEGCVIEKFTVHSPAMDRDIQGLVVLPPEYGAHPEKHYPILYTLHGTGAPYDTFSKMTPLREALRGKPMIVTCFDADNASDYLDSPHPQRWSRQPDDPSLARSLFTTFFFDEFLPCLDANYRVDPARRMLTGFSMGGFGAFHYLLSKPGQFCSVSSLSGWFPDWQAPTPWEQKRLAALAGPPEENTKRYLATDFRTRIKQQVAAGVKFPPLLLLCGTEDKLLDHSRALAAFLHEQGIACESVESPGGHNWPYWQGASAGVIDFHWRTLPGK